MAFVGIPARKMKSPSRYNSATRRLTTANVTSTEHSANIGTLAIMRRWKNTDISFTRLFERRCSESAFSLRSVSKEPCGCHM
eukprot:5526647-Prymnesium_polylepis.2